MYKLTLNDNSIFLVKLTKKQGDTLEEYKLVDKVPDECKNVNQKDHVNVNVNMI